ncbi:hypothetical protein ABI_28620 [Asticcacaulis biprosthecium C19]|uniref:Uncharacterized protein n=1 Tax=Asticcacaulis biprosthecium C19 TaxID=715226 RepID=F4QMK5_9CAUL|nr:hypothetical protein ABI_28620 [Asticcacaulis biprosthecium C19]
MGPNTHGNIQPYETFRFFKVSRLAYPANFAGQRESLA